MDDRYGLHFSGVLQGPPTERPGRLPHSTLGTVLLRRVPVLDCTHCSLRMCPEVSGCVAFLCSFSSSWVHSRTSSSGIRYPIGKQHFPASSITAFLLFMTALECGYRPWCESGRFTRFNDWHCNNGCAFSASYMGELVYLTIVSSWIIISCLLIFGRSISSDRSKIHIALDNITCSFKI